jgi:sigma-B regulation protein RsbU (phosphoserine phosphatase)
VNVTNPLAIAEPRSIIRPLDVLVADDDDLLSAFIEIKLMALDCRVETVADGRAALDRLRERRFDVLVTDWNMPGLDGMELVRQLRTERRADDYLYIIMMTARTDQNGVRAGLRAGVDDFIRKPLDDVELELGIASARRIVDLQRRLVRRTRHIAAAHRRTREAYQQIKLDLEAAAETQRQLLPPPQAIGPLRTAGLFLPSFSIGGDIYDIVPEGDDCLRFFHVDVVGHGVPAALRSFALHNQLSNRPSNDTLSGFIRQLNDQTTERDEDYFTMVYGAVDAKGLCRMVRAGHPLPIHFSRESKRLVSLEDGGLPVGLLPAVDYPEVQVQLAPGDRLFLYSDGVTDCEDADGRPYGDARLQDAIVRTADLPITAAVQAIETSLKVHRAGTPLRDDVSLLALEMVGD